MGPLLLTLLAATGGGACPQRDPGAATHSTAVVIVGEPAAGRAVAARLEAVLRCTEGFEPVPAEVARSLAVARAKFAARCNASASCLLERLPFDGVDRVLVATLPVRDGQVNVELALHSPSDAAPLARSARVSPEREVAATAAVLLGRLLSHRDPPSEAYARRDEDPAAFAALAERSPAWRHTLALQPTPAGGGESELPLEPEAAPAEARPLLAAPPGSAPCPCLPMQPPCREPAR